MLALFIKMIPQWASALEPQGIDMFRTCPKGHNNSTLFKNSLYKSSPPSDKGKKLTIKWL